MMKRTPLPYLLFLFISLVWGVSFLLMKKAAIVFSPLSVGGWRLLGGACALAVVGLLRRNPWRLPRHQMPKIVLVALWCYGYPYSLQPYLVVRYGSGFIGMFVAFVPVLTILISIPALGVYPTRRQLFGVLGGLLCLGVIMVDGIDRQIPSSDLLLAVTVPIAYASANTFIRKKLHDVPLLPMSTMILFIASATLLLLSLATGFLEPLGLAAPSAVPSDYEWMRAIVCLLILGVVGTGLTVYAFNKLIVDEGPLFAGMVTYLIPLGAVFWGLLDGEAITLRQMIALAGVLVTVWLVQSRSTDRIDPKEVCV